MEKVYKAVVEYMTEHGYAPTVRELCDMTGYKSTATVACHINKLLEKGKLETDAGTGIPRAIRVPGYKFVKER